MAPRVAALGVSADPFAAPAQGGTVAMAPGAGVGGYPGGAGAPMQQAKLGMDQAFAAVREDDFSQGVAGLPGGKPAWLLPLIVGVLALVLGGAVTLVVMMR
jgi:hypothetical protein